MGENEGLPVLNSNWIRYEEEVAYGYIITTVLYKTTLSCTCRGGLSYGYARKGLQEILNKLCKESDHGHAEKTEMVYSLLCGRKLYQLIFY